MFAPPWGQQAHPAALAAYGGVHQPMPALPPPNPTNPFPATMALAVAGHTSYAAELHRLQVASVEAQVAAEVAQRLQGTTAVHSADPLPSSIIALAKAALAKIQPALVAIGTLARIPDLDIDTDGVQGRLAAASASLYSAADVLQVMAVAATLTSQSSLTDSMAVAVQAVAKNLGEVGASPAMAQLQADMLRQARDRRPVQPRAPGQMGQPRQAIICYSCNRPGHIAAHCRGPQSDGEPPAKKPAWCVGESACTPSGVESFKCGPSPLRVMVQTRKGAHGPSQGVQSDTGPHGAEEVDVPDGSAGRDTADDATADRTASAEDAMCASDTCDVTDVSDVDECLLFPAGCERGDVVCDAVVWPASCAELSASTPIMMRLSICAEYWEKELHAPPSVMRLIKSGYRWPFEAEPARFARPNHASAHQYADFVDAELARLVAMGGAVVVTDQPAGVCALGVDDSRAKLRMLLDGRPLNAYLRHQRFRYEGINEVRLLLRPGARMVWFDLKSAYHHVRVHENHCSWQACKWRGAWFVFPLMQFGVSSAPMVFTKLTRPLVRYLRSRGVMVVMMLDDGLVVLRDPHMEVVHLVRQTLQRSGFLVAEEKSNWEPSPRAEGYLGYCIDTEMGTLAIKAQRVAKLVAALQECVRGRRLTRRQVARVTGMIVSMGLVLGDSCRIMTRHLFMAQGGSQYGWERSATMTDGAWRELSYWQQRAIDGSLAASTPLWPAPMPWEVVVSTDASATGMGAVLERCGGETDEAAYAALAEQEKLGSSTLRELLAALFGMESLLSTLRERTVLWRTDNQAAVIIVRVGSRHAHLQEVALRIANLCEVNKVALIPRWVPRCENTAADAASRRIDVADYALASMAYSETMRAFHFRPDVDLFADHESAKTERFFSVQPVPRSSGVDAFAHPWEGARLYAFPPLHMVGRVVVRLRTMAVCAAVLILPLWPSQPWWPLIFPDGLHTCREVVAWRVLHRSDFQLGPSGRPRFLTEPGYRFNALAVRWESGGCRFGATPKPFCFNRVRKLHCGCCSWTAVM